VSKFGDDRQSDVGDYALKIERKKKSISRISEWHVPSIADTRSYLAIF